ncbi:alpha-ketoglutarate-dependent dioxygenase AlkB family protein [Niabella aquatica]
MQQKLFNYTEQFFLPQELLTYTPGFISFEESNSLLSLLLNTVPWQQHTVMMYDREVITPRLSAFYGDKSRRDEGKREALPWLPELYQIKERIAQFTCVREYY